MAPERVYQAARRLRVSSQRLLVYLEAHHAPHATASSNLTADGAALLAGATTSQVLLDSARHYRPKPMRREVYWSWQQMDPEDDWYWVDERRIWKNWIGPDQLTTSQAAQAWAVSTATIRQWVHRGYLNPLGTKGRSAVFSALDVLQAAIATGDRNQQPGGPLRRDQERREPVATRVRGKDLQRIVTAEAAAAVVGVSPSTIRSWKRRGHLHPAQRRGRTPLYRVADVLAAARRSPHRPQRLYRGLR